jgi:hypothetical protein
MGRYGLAGRNHSAAGLLRPGWPVALTVMLMVVLTLAFGAPASAGGPLQGHSWSPADVTPPPRPQINPVSPNDDAVVRPNDVNGLPVSGVGYAGPDGGTIQRWTNVAIIALALNAIVLLCVAWRSRRRHRA